MTCPHSLDFPCLGPARTLPSPCTGDYQPPLGHTSSCCTAHRVSGRHLCGCPSVFTLKVFSAGHSFPNRMLELYLFNLFSQKLKYFTNHDRLLSQHACLCFLASGWPELQPLSWMVVTGSGSQQMKPAALVLLDWRHRGFTDTGGKADSGVGTDRAFSTLSGSARLQVAGKWGQQLGRQVMRAEPFPFPSVLESWYIPGHYQPPVC